MKKRLTKIMSMLLCCVMLLGLLPTTAFAAVVKDEDGNISYEPTEQGTYSNGRYTIDKISHPTRGAGQVDGILTGEDQDRGNSYSWSMADASAFIHVHMDEATTADLNALDGTKQVRLESDKYSTPFGNYRLMAPMSVKSKANWWTENFAKKVTAQDITNVTLAGNKFYGASDKIVIPMTGNETYTVTLDSEEIKLVVYGLDIQSQLDELLSKLGQMDKDSLIAKIKELVKDQIADSQLECMTVEQLKELLESLIIKHQYSLSCLCIYISKKAVEPEETAPNKPVATDLPTSYTVRCVTEGSGHTAQSVPQIADTASIGAVSKSGDSYVCPITVSTEKYAEKYSKEVNAKHSAVSTTITYNMTWNGTGWVAPLPTSLPPIDVKCDDQPEETAPNKPVATDLPTSYTVRCVTEGSGHTAQPVPQISDTASIGAVSKSGDSYVCPITVSTEKYAEKYSKEVNAKHSAVSTTITYNMTWNGTGWVAPLPTSLPPIDVKCDDQPEETVTITFKVVNGTWTDGTTRNKTVEIEKGSAMGTEQIPNGMKPYDGYENGQWNNESALTGVQNQDATYTYTFSKKESDHNPPVVNKKYILNYETNGGSSILPEQKSKKWTKDFEDLPVPTRKGYTFDGWFYNKNLTKAVKGDVKVNGIVTIYAKWVRSVADPRDTGVANWLNTEEHIAFLHGYKDGTFAPDRNMSRAEVAQMFYNLLLNKELSTSVQYKDVKDSDWFAPAVRTLSEMGIITGYKDGTFKPYKAVTRAEFTVIAMRFAKLDNSGENIFTDVHEGDWYYDAIVGSVKYGWINGYDDGTFRPNTTVTRAGVATIVDHMLGRSADEGFVDDHANELVYFSDLKDSYWAYYNIMEATNAHSYRQNDAVEDWKTLQ